MSLQDRLELEAKIRARSEEFARNKPVAKGMPPPSPGGNELMRRALGGTNVGMPGAVLGARPNTYYVPKDLNAGAWTNTDTGDVFIARSRLPIPNLAAHEALHSRIVGMGGEMPQSPGDWPVRRELARNLSQIQPPAAEAGPFWGLDPSRSAEEQIANIAGYEGALPAGMPITKSLIGDRIFQGSALGASSQQVKDYYFEKSSLPYKGVWEGQVTEPSTLTKAMSTAKRLATRLGINTERFNQPGNTQR